MNLFRHVWINYETRKNNFVHVIDNLKLTGDAMLSLKGNTWLDAYVSFVL